MPWVSCQSLQGLDSALAPPFYIIFPPSVYGFQVSLSSNRLYTLSHLWIMVLFTGWSWCYCGVNHQSLVLALLNRMVLLESKRHHLLDVARALLFKIKVLKIARR